MGQLQSSFAQTRIRLYCTAILKDGFRILLLSKLPVTVLQVLAGHDLGIALAGRQRQGGNDNQ